MRQEEFNNIKVLTGITFLGIIMQQVIGRTGYLPNLSYSKVLLLTILLAISKFAFPMMIFLVGFVLFYNHFENCDIKKYYIKLTTNIIMPYILCNILYHYWSIYELNAPHYKNIYDIFQNIFWGKEIYHLWGIALVIQFCLLFPLFRKYFKWIKKHKQDEFTHLFLWLIIYIGLIKLHTQIIPVYIKTYPENFLTDFLFKYRGTTFIYWIFYFIFGGYAALNYEKMLNEVKRYKYVVLAAYFIILSYVVYIVLSKSILTATGYKVDYELTTPFSLYILALSVASIYLYTCLISVIDANKNKLLEMFKFIGKYTCGGYLLYPIIIYYVFKLYISLNSFNAYMQTILGFILVSIISIIISFSISKIPIFKKLCYIFQENK